MIMNDMLVIIIYLVYFNFNGYLLFIWCWIIEIIYVVWIGILFLYFIVWIGICILIFFNFLLLKYMCSL